MDITQHVIGKFNENGSFQLFYDNECVGEFLHTTNEFKMKNGYEQRKGEKAENNEYNIHK